MFLKFVFTMPYLKRPVFLFLLALIVMLLGCTRQREETGTRVRLAYFPNVTHASAIVGVADGTFQRELDRVGTTHLEPIIFSAGPRAMEALLAKEVDVAFLGSSPAINGFVKSKGAVRIVSGAASGGAVLVARADSGILRPEDIAGKRIATPQQGGTQDVAARYYVKEVLHRRLKEEGGDTAIVATEPPEIVALFARKELDAAWVAEPWGTRLIQEQGARLLLDERDLWPERRFATTVIVARTEFLDAHPKIVESLVLANKVVGQRLQEQRQVAIPLLQSEIKRLTKRNIATSVLTDSLARVDFTSDPMQQNLAAQAEHSFSLGFLKTKPDLTGLVVSSLEAEGNTVKLARDNQNALLPTPLQITQFLTEALREGTLLPAIGVSLARGGLGFLFSMVVGTVLGLLLARIDWLDRTLGKVVTAIQSLPSVCWFPLALLWFGLSEWSVFFVVALGSVFAVALSVRAGIRSLSPLFARVGTVLGARGMTLWTQVLLPASLPAFLSGARQGWAFAWRSLMAAELLSQSLRAGVGHLLNTGRDLNDMPMVAGMILVILLLGLLIDLALFGPAERLIKRRWGVSGA
jgi:aliphatic sulfonates family ABC transporter substrate-binding protein